MSMPSPKELQMPTDADIHSAIEEIRARGEVAPETIWMTVLAMRNPEIQAILQRQLEYVTPLLDLDPESSDKAVLLSVLVSAYVSGLNMGLTLAA